MIQSSTRHLPIGSTLQGGKYKIVKVLGHGGFGITYLAEHKIFGDVALKELFLNSGNTHCTRDNTTRRQVIAHFEGAQFDAFKKRFSEEAHTLFKLRGVPGVVNVLDTFEENSTVYFSMEYLQGEKLEDYVKRKNGLPEEEGLRIITSIAAALSKIHEKDVLHRDIKPANIIVNESETVHLIDFGIARSYAEEITETHLHTTFHSPRYSPPEQKLARSRMGTYSDIYSLGATAYFVFTNSPPQNVEERLLSDDGYKSPKEIIPTLSTEINDTINQSLKLKHVERIQTAEDFLKALSGRLAFKATSVVSNQDKTIIDTPSFSARNQDETLISATPTDESSSDQTIIENDISSSENKVDHESTQIFPQPLRKVKELNWKKAKNWLFQTNKGRATIGGTTLLMLVLIVFFLNRKPSEPDITELDSHYISLNVMDFLDQKLENVQIEILGTDSVFVRDSLENYHLDISRDWEKLKDRIVIFSKSGYFLDTLQVASIVDTIYNIRLISKIENPKEFSKNIEGQWYSDANDTLTFEIGKYRQNENPKGSATFNNRLAGWISYQSDEEMIISIVLNDNGDNLNFYINNPFDQDEINLDLERGNSLISFKKSKMDSAPINIPTQGPEPPEKITLKRKIVNNDNNDPIRNAIVTIVNTNEIVRTNSGGWFTLDITNFEDSYIKITHGDFETKRLRISVLNNNINSIKLIPKTVQPPDPIPPVPQDKIKTVAITAKIVDYKGDPIPDVQIQVPQGNSIRELRTDPEGNFSLTITDSEENLNKLKVNIQHPSGRYIAKKSLLLTSFKSNEKIKLEFSESEKNRIFCENIQGIWKLEGKLKRLRIKSCDLSNPGGDARFESNSGTWEASQFSGGRELVTVRIPIDIEIKDPNKVSNQNFNDLFIFKVYNPFDKEKIYLELFEQKRFNTKLQLEETKFSIGEMIFRKR